MVHGSWLKEASPGIEKHEIEDLLPQIYFEVFEKEFPGADTQSSALFDQETSEILQKSCEDDRLLYEVTRNLISLEMKYKNQQSRRGIYKEIDKTIAQGFFDNAEDAKSWKKRQLSVKESKAGELLKIMEESDSWYWKRSSLRILAYLRANTR